MSLGARRGALHPAALSLLLVLPILAALAWIGAPTSAHFLLNVNIRVIHVVHEQGRMRLLIRLPMPYLVADKLGPATAEGVRAPAPYTTNRIEDGKPVHYLDAEALRNAPGGLARILADGLEVEAGGETLRAKTGRIRAYPALKQPPFARLEEAEAALAGPVYADGFEVTFVGDTVVDAELIYPTRRRHDEYTLRSRLDPGLPGQDETANLVLDHATDPPLIFRLRGLIARPVLVSRSVLEAAWTFIVEGVRHILEGLDHVLFVVCLVLGATGLGSLAWRVTGFTIGHSVTLTLGFFGYHPGAAWFVPLVETGIALSIVYAAVIAAISVEHRLTTGVTALLGLLHGLGFSFVLREVLKLDSPNLWQSLLAFNLGIEAGQLMIVLAMWPLLMLIANRLPGSAVPVRRAVALPCLLIAAIWTGERATQLISTL